MPWDPLPPRACRSNPKYTFSEDEDDEEKYSPFSSPDVDTKPLPPDLTSTASPIFPPPYPSKSHSRKRSPSHIRRPRNAFIIFRSEYCCKQKADKQIMETDHRQISRIAAHIWRGMSEDDKAEYKDRAEEEKAAHKAAYPNYRYAPVGRPRAIVKPKVKRSSNEEVLRCREAAEVYLAGLQEKKTDNSPEKPDDKIAPKSVRFHSSSNQRTVRRLRSMKKRKEEMYNPASPASLLSVALPKQDEQCAEAMEICNKDNPVPDSQRPPLTNSPDSSPRTISTLDETLLSVKEEPLEFEPIPLHLKNVHEDPLMPSPMDESSDAFDHLTLGQLFKSPSEKDSELPYSPPSDDCDKDEEVYDPNSETSFSTPCEALFPESGDGSTATCFEAQLGEKGTFTSNYKDSNAEVCGEMEEIEQYLCL